MVVANVWKLVVIFLGVLSHCFLILVGEVFLQLSHQSHCRTTYTYIAMLISGILLPLVFGLTPFSDCRTTYTHIAMLISGILLPLVFGLTPFSDCGYRYSSNVGPVSCITRLSRMLEGWDPFSRFSYQHG